MGGERVPESNDRCHDVRRGIGCIDFNRIVAAVSQRADPNDWICAVSSIVTDDPEMVDRTASASEVIPVSSCKSLVSLVTLVSLVSLASA